MFPYSLTDASIGFTTHDSVYEGGYDISAMCRGTDVRRFRSGHSESAHKWALAFLWSNDSPSALCEVNDRNAHQTLIGSGKREFRPSHNHSIFRKFISEPDDAR